jgi:hypothetical protein
MDHDALFKWLLKDPVILRSFFEEFLPDVASYTDFSKLEYLDKEMRTLRGQKRTGDLLAKVRFKKQEAAFLIHVEHEARRDKDIAWRLLEYAILDRRASGLPVYPVLVFAGRTGPAPKTPLRIAFPDRCVLTFDFPVIELARLDARDFVRKENAAALALTTRMKFRLEEQEDLILGFAATLGRSPMTNEVADRTIRYFLAYQQLDEKKALKVEERMGKLGSAMISEKAIDRLNPFFLILQRRGRQSEGTTLVLRQLRRRLGPLPAARRRAIEKLSLRRIEALGEALLDFNSPEDLERWLRRNSAPASSPRTSGIRKRSRRP